MGTLLRETFRAMIRGIEHQFGDGDLSLSHWLTLKLISSGRISCIGDVNRELDLNSGTSTRLVDQLEKRDLLYRRRSSMDRRVVGIKLTPLGEQVLEDMRPRLGVFWREQLAIFTDDEQEILFTMLLRLRDGLIASSRDRL